MNPQHKADLTSIQIRLESSLTIPTPLLSGGFSLHRGRAIAPLSPLPDKRKIIFYYQIIFLINLIINLPLKNYKNATAFATFTWQKTD